MKFQLTANELLFFPQSYNPAPIRQKTIDPNDSIRKMNYITKINDHSEENQRNFRAKRDARYLHQNGSNDHKLEKMEKPILCIDHLIGRCKSECGRMHQMRHQRQFGVCKFYLSGVCKNGDTCQFMHEDFPCRYYYLDLDHPKLEENECCRFKHGGPLPKRLRQYFCKQIEIWAEKIAQKKQQPIEDIFQTFMDKFDAKQCKLEAEYQSKQLDSSPVPLLNDRFMLESVLSISQIRRLAEQNITNAAQINQIPLEELLDYGLSIDDIFKITTNTFNECCQTPINHELQHTQNNTCIDDLTVDRLGAMINSFRGYSEIEVKDAAQMLQNLQQGFKCYNRIELDKTVTNYDIRVKCDGIVTKTIIQKNTQIMDSSDSDDELSLVINEDFS